MSEEIEISEAARECAYREILAYNGPGKPALTRGKFVQLLLNQETEALRKELACSSKSIDNFSERLLLQISERAKEKILSGEQLAAKDKQIAELREALHEVFNHPEAGAPSLQTSFLCGKSCRDIARDVLNQTRQIPPSPAE